MTEERKFAILFAATILAVGGTAPLISLVLPMLILDAGHIAPEHRLSTLTPFVIGLVLAICGLILTRSAGT